MRLAACAGVYVLSLTVDARGQERIWEEFGDAAGDHLGNAVSAAGDVNGDGYPDVIAGEHFHNSGTGRARVYSGLDGSTLFTFDGGSTYENLGYSVAAPGDLNGDGWADVAVGALVAGTTHAGFVKVFSGMDGSVLYSINGQAGDELGFSLDAVSDINGDGVGDLVVGTAGWYALVASGKDGSTIWTLTRSGTNYSFGQSVAGVGDVDQDGVADVIVGDPQFSGVVSSGGGAWVFSGANGSILYTFYGTYYQFLGTSVGTPGDVNADGYSDLIVGAPGDSSVAPDSGLVVVYSGQDGSILYSIVPIANPSDNFALGGAVCEAGDQNRDGFDDFLVGVPGYYDLGCSSVCGAAFLYSGRDGGFLYHFAGTGGDSTYSVFGNALAPVGDVDGDGMVDFTIADPLNDAPGMRDAGSVSLSLGSDLFLDATPKRASAGQSVAFTTAQGIAGNPALMVVVFVNGAPTFIPFDLSLLDATGRRQIQGVVPPGLGSMTLGLKAYTLNGPGKLIDSGVETLTLQ
jgi:hypothetical protein